MSSWPSPDPTHDVNEYPPSENWTASFYDPEFYNPNPAQPSQPSHKPMEAAAVGAAGQAASGIGSSWISGGFGLANTLIDAHNKDAINRRNIDFQTSQLDFAKQRWNTEYSTARSLGLASPVQIANPLAGGFYHLQGRSFTPSSRSDLSNIWN